jgi:putative heme-binding domain-containing protein
MSSILQEQLRGNDVRTNAAVHHEHAPTLLAMHHHTRSSQARRLNTRFNAAIWSTLLAAFLFATAIAPPLVRSDTSVPDVRAGADLFLTDCAGCHGRDGTGLRGPDLTRGIFRHGADAAALFRTIGGGIPASPMPGALSMHSEQAVWQLVAYVQSLNHPAAPTPPGGDADSGKLLFETRGRCLDCHSVGGRGAFLGPSLNGIGLLRSAASLRLSLVRPSAEVDPAWWSVRVVDAGGAVHVGRRLDEDTYSVRSLEGGRLRSFQRAAVRSIDRIETSPMPAYDDEMTPAEIEDLVTYLSTLTRL